MANPRQRRKARSGNGKVKSSRRQQDKLRKVVVTGPEILRKEWDIHKTARQNLDKLGLARRPLSLKQSGGIEKLVPDEQPQQDNEDAASSLSEEDAYASEHDIDEDSDNATDDDNEHAQPQAGPSNTQPPMDKTSKSIPKGFARIIRDAQGNVVDVVMSAFDEPDDKPKLNTIEAEEALIKSEQQAAEADDVETPWGKPLISREHETRLKKAAVPVLAKSAALRELERRTEIQNKTTASSQRYASTAEQDSLSALARKYGNDINAMAKDLKLNKDQRTAGQLSKAFKRCGGVESFLR